MARLDLPRLEHRVFKDDSWQYRGEVWGYLSIGDLRNVPPVDGHLYAFAVEAGEPASAALYDDITKLRHPFMRAEIERVGSEVYAIGFFHPDHAEG
jgi:hypothetical protein